MKNPKQENVRLASNRVYFATLDGRTGWKVTKDTVTSTQVRLWGNPEVMLQGLLQAKERIEELGVTILGKKEEDGLVIEVSAK